VLIDGQGTNRKSIKLIDWLTYPEILYCNYIDYNVPLVSPVLANPPEISKDKIANWLKPYEMKFLTD